MAIYHFSVHMISRRAGRSAVKAAAWCAGERLRDEMTGELADFVKRRDVLHREIGDDKYRAPTLLRNLVAAGWLGKKSGKGFYVYDDKGQKLGNAL